MRVPRRGQSEPVIETQANNLRRQVGRGSDRVEIGDRLGRRRVYGRAAEIQKEIFSSHCPIATERKLRSGADDSSGHQPASAAPCQCP